MNKLYIFKSKQRASLLVILFSLLILLVPRLSNGQASNLVPFQPRTSPNAQNQEIYHIKGDFTMLGNTNLTLQDYSDNRSNSSQMRYVNVDAMNAHRPFNSSSAELRFSDEGGADSNCTHIVFAGLYWTGRAHNNDSPHSFEVAKTVPGNTPIPVASEQNVEHDDNVNYTGYRMAISRQGNSGSRYPRYSFTGSGLPTVDFEFRNGTGYPVHYRISGGAWQNVSNQQNTTPTTNRRHATFDPVVIYTSQGITLNVNELRRDSRTDQSTNTYQNNSYAVVSVTGEFYPGVEIRRTLDKRVVKLRHESENAYQEVVASTGNFTQNIYYDGENDYASMYAAYADITEYVREHGVGYYTVADIALREEGDGGDIGYYGGWGMVVVYENSKMKWRDITVFDGYSFIEVLGWGTTQHDLLVSGFNAVQQGDVNVKIGMMAGEGDRAYDGDFFSIKQRNSNTFDRLSHAANSPDNFFNSSINTGRNGRNPNPLNNTGMDIAMFNIDNLQKQYISNSDTATTFRYGSNRDVYAIFSIVVGIDAYIPEPEAENLIAEITDKEGGVIPVQPGGTYTVEPGAKIKYTLNIRNKGSEGINDLNIKIPVPYTTEYVSSRVTTDGTFQTGQPIFDPSVGSAGEIRWEVGNVPMATDPDHVFATLEFELQVIDNCDVLITSGGCPATASISGSMSGSGTTTGIEFMIDRFIYGFGTEGDCSEEPIVTPPKILIDIQNTCEGISEIRNIKVCGSADAVSFEYISTHFQNGTRFYDAIVDSTGKPPVDANEFTSATDFPSTEGVVYYGVPSSLNTNCYWQFTIEAIAPPTFATDNADVCQGDSINLRSLVKNLLPTDSQIAFYSDSSAGVPIDTIAKPTSDTVYWAKAYVKGSNCSSDILPIEITVNELPTLTIITKDTAVCSNEAVIFNLKEMLTMAGGDSLQFSEAKDFSVLINPSDTYEVDTNKTSKVYVRALNTTTGCFTSAEAIDSLTLMVNGLPEVHVTLEAKDTVVCSVGDAIFDLTIMADNTTDSLVFSENKIFSPPISGITTYHVAPNNTVKLYVKAVNRVTACETPEDGYDSLYIQVNRYATPADITAANDTVCYNTPATLVATSTLGDSIRWYTHADRTGFLVSNDTLITGNLDRDTTFYVSVQSDTICENQAGSLKAVHVKVNSHADTLQINASNQVICTGTGATLRVSATGVVSPVYRWYASQDATTPVLENIDSLKTGILTTITTRDTVFYVSVEGENYYENLTGKRKAIHLTIYQTPVLSIRADEDSVCIGAINPSTGLGRNSFILTLTLTGAENPSWYGWFHPQKPTEPIADPRSQFLPAVQDELLDSSLPDEFDYIPYTTEKGKSYWLKLQVNTGVCGYVTDSIRLTSLPFPAKPAFNLVTQPLAGQNMCVDTIYQLKVKADTNTLHNVRVSFDDKLSSELTVLGAYYQYPYNDEDTISLGAGTYTDPEFRTWNLPDLEQGDSLLMTVRVAAQCGYYEGGIIDFHLNSRNNCNDSLARITRTTNQYFTTDTLSKGYSYEIYNFVNEMMCDTLHCYTVNNTRLSDTLDWKGMYIVRGTGHVSDSTRETIDAFMPAGLTPIDGSFKTLSLPDGLIPAGNDNMVETPRGWRMRVKVPSGMNAGDTLILASKFHVSAANCGTYRFQNEVFYIDSSDCGGVRCGVNRFLGGAYSCVDIDLYRFELVEQDIFGRMNNDLWSAFNDSISVRALTPFYQGDTIPVKFYHDENNNSQHDELDTYVTTVNYVTHDVAQGDTFYITLKDIPAKKGKQLLAKIERNGNMCQEVTLPIVTIFGTHLICQYDTITLTTAENYAGYTPDMEPSDSSAHQMIRKYTLNVDKIDAISGATPLRIGALTDTANVYKAYFPGKGSFRMQMTYTVLPSWMPQTRQVGVCAYDIIVVAQPYAAYVNNVDTSICTGSPVDLSTVFYDTTALDTRFNRTIRYYQNVAGTYIPLDTLTSIDPMLVTPYNTTTYAMELIYSDSLCASNLLPYTIVVNRYAVADDITVADDTVCYNTQAVLIATSSVGDSIRWYADAGRTNLLATNDTLITGNLDRDTTFYVSVQNDTICENQAGNLKAVKVEVKDLTTLSSKRDTTICNQESVDLNTLVTLEENTSATFYTAVNGTLIDPPTVSPSAMTKYFILVSSTYPPDCTTWDSLTVNVNSLPTVTVKPSGKDTSVCSSNAVLFNLKEMVATSGDSLQFSTDRSFAEANIINPATAFEMSVDADSTVYVRALNTTTGCYTGVGAIDTLRITVNGLPSVSVTVAGNKDSVCSDVSYYFNLKDMVYAVSDSLQFSTDKNFATANLIKTATSYEVAVNSDSLVYVRALNITTGCFSGNSAIDSIKLRVNSLPKVALTLSSKDTAVCSNISVNFDLTAMVDNTTDSLVFSKQANFATALTDITAHSVSVNTTDTIYVKAVSLTTGCETPSTAYDTLRITINGLPTIAVHTSAHDTNVCANGAINFSLRNMVSSYSGDSLQFSVNRTFIPLLTATQVTAYTVDLNASSTVYVRALNSTTACMTDGSAIDSIKMTVNQQPTAGFTYALDGANSRKVDFINSSTPASGLSYFWDFGDGTGADTVKDPSYAYAVSGEYTVSLAVDNRGCTAEYREEIFIGATVEGGFSVNAQSQCSEDNQFIFTNLTKVTGTTPEYLWDFGDGQTSADKNPVHRYATPGTYTVILYASSTDITPPIKDTFEMELNVVPTPNVTNAINHEYCNGDTAMTHYFTGDVDNTVYKWYRIIGQDNDQTGMSQYIGLDSLPTFIATNIGYLHMPAAYKITPYYTQNGYACQGQPINFLITVNPTTTVAPVADQTYCDGQEVSPFRFTGNNTNNTNFEWRYISGDPIAGLPLSGHTELPRFAAKNDGATTLTSTYVVTPSYTYANTPCLGKTDTFRISILPKAKINGGTILPAICSSAGINYLLSSDASGITYNWLRLSNADINEAPRSGTGNLVDTLTNNRNRIVNVEYLITANNGQCSYSETVNLSVYPEVLFTNTLQLTNNCSGAAVNTTLISNVLGATYTWNRLPNSDITEPASSGASAFINETLTNTSTNATVVKYALTATANGCTTKDTLTVNVAPKLSFGGSLVIADTVCSNSEITYGLPQTAGVSYAWQRVFNGNVAPHTNSGSGNPINEVIRNTSGTLQTVTYNVTLFSQGCSGVDQVQVAILPEPEANFNMQLTGLGKVSFSNQSTGTATYAWNFGDGQTSTEENPVHPYSQSGTYIVTLTAISEKGCPATTSKTITVSTKIDLVADFTVNQGVQCLNGNSFLFNDKSTVSTLGHTISAWKWYFGDGDSSDVQNPAHTYKQAGSYTVSLTVTEIPGNTLKTYGQIVQVIGKPVITITVPPAICEGSKLTLPTPEIDWQGNAPVEGVWTLDGYIFDNNKIMTVADSGKILKYQVPTVCGDTASNGVTVIVYAKPVADFMVQVTGLGLVSFTNTTVADAGSGYQWNFGDGQTSNVKDPVHAYAQSGAYTVTLTATSANTCASTISKQVSVSTFTNMVADFSVNTNVQCLSSNSFVFKNKSTITTPNHGISSYAWDFGDNTAIVTTKDATHTYTQAGTYTVTLTVTETPGNTQSSAVQTIQVIGKPIITITVPAGICEDNKLALSAPVINWQGNTPTEGIWILDGQIFDKNRIMTVADSGKILTYKLTSNCGDTSSNKVPVIVYANPNSDFATQVTGLGQVSFTNFSTGATGYVWNFGDGTTSTIKDPVHQYAQSGDYLVRLMAVNSNGCLSVIDKNIAVSTSTDLSADFSVNTSVQCLDNNSFVFKNKSTITTPNHSISNYAWSFGDGTAVATTGDATHTYVQPGIYTVTMTVTETPGNTSASAVQTIQVLDKPVVYDTAAIAAVCEGDYLQVSIPSIDWKGNTVVTGVWLLGGKVFDPLTMAMKVTDNGKLLQYRVSSSCGTALGSGRVVTVNAKPVVNTILDAMYCSGVQIPAQILGNISGVTYQWKQSGDHIGLSTQSGNNTIPAFNAVNNGTSPLVAYFEVTAMNGNCRGNTIHFSITVSPRTKVSSDLTVAPVCSGSMFTYTIQSITQGAQFNWRRLSQASINNGNTSSAVSSTIEEVLTISVITPVVVQYEIASTSAVCTQAYKDTLRVTVNPVPTINNVQNFTYCSDVPVATYTFQGDVPGTTYQWEQMLSGGNMGLAATNGTNAIPAFTASNTTANPITSTYKVKATYANGYSACSSQEYVFSITVNPAILLTSPSTMDSICSGSAFVYTATSNIGTASYTWTRAAINGINTGKSGSGQGASISEVLTNTTSAPVTVVYQITPNANGCTGTTANVAVVVYPAASVALTTEVDVCATDSKASLSCTNNNPALATYYRITFDNNALAAGFQNMNSYALLSGNSIDITLPARLLPLHYTGIISIKTEGCDNAQIYDFGITVLQTTAITQQPVSEVELCSGSDNTLYLEVKATGSNLQYQWYKNGTAITGATGSTYEKIDVTESDYGIYTVEVTGDCGTLSGTATKVKGNELVILQKWGKVLFVSGRDGAGNESEYKYFQWYRVNVSGNMIAIAENANVQYYTEEGISGVFMVKVIYADGSYRMSCPYTVTSSAKHAVQIYPNPARISERINVLLDFGDEDVAGSIIEVFDITGKKQASVTTTQALTEVYMNVASGTYVFRITDPQGNVIVEKVVIK